VRFADSLGLITPTRLGLTYRVCDNPFAGAHLLGATSVAEQYYERARKHLANLFDTSSYAVAEAMFSMGYYVYAQVGRRASALTTHCLLTNVMAIFRANPISSRITCLWR
jgi:hypothetical protein